MPTSWFEGGFRGSLKKANKPHIHTHAHAHIRYKHTHTQNTDMYQTYMSTCGLQALRAHWVTEVIRHSIISDISPPAPSDEQWVTDRLLPDTPCMLPTTQGCKHITIPSSNWVKHLDFFFFLSNQCQLLSVFLKLGPEEDADCKGSESQRSCRSLGRIKMSAENILLLILVGHNMKEKMSNNIWRWILQFQTSEMPIKKRAILRVIYLGYGKGCPTLQIMHFFLILFKTPLTPFPLSI